MINNLSIDFGYKSLNHFGEELCGDHVEIVKDKVNDSLTIVLADGLGSGVKANILAILTSKIISDMIANGANIESCVDAIASTLPVCKIRGVAYSTFSICHVIKNKIIEIYEFDNPRFILLRNGRVFNPKSDELEINGKKIYKTILELQKEDAFLFFSDGAVHAGIGATLNFGWERDDIAAFISNLYVDDYSAKTLCTILSDKCKDLYESKPGDDTTILALKVKRRSYCNLMMGPSKTHEEDPRMCSEFLSMPGSHIVSGGTTSQVLARYLKEPITVDADLYIKNDIPPIAHLKGVDLVTEGVITLSKVLEYASSYLEDNSNLSEWMSGRDGASKITRLMIDDATDVNFFIGTAINPAHQNPNLPISYNIKMHIVESLASKLESMGKRVKINYY